MAVGSFICDDKQVWKKTVAIRSRQFDSDAWRGAELWDLLDEDGMPVGFQILAPARADQIMYEVAGALEALGSDAAGMKARIVTDDVVARLSENLEARVPSRAEFSAERTDSWTDADGKKH